MKTRCKQWNGHKLYITVYTSQVIVIFLRKEYHQLHKQPRNVFFFALIDALLTRAASTSSWMLLTTRKIYKPSLSKHKLSGANRRRYISHNNVRVGCRRRSLHSIGTRTMKTTQCSSKVLNACSSGPWAASFSCCGVFFRRHSSVVLSSTRHTSHVSSLLGRQTRKRT